LDYSTLADEHKVGVFQNKDLPKIYEMKPYEATGEWTGDCVFNLTSWRVDFWEHMIHLRQTLNVDALVLMRTICFGLDFKE
jgi:hypothetical protein